MRSDKTLHKSLQVSLLWTFWLLLIPCFLSGCAFYHNTTARFNAYFLAKEKMLEAENNLELERKEDFNNILYPLLRIQDSLVAASQKANFEYVIEKASLPVQNHPSSEYVDWSYLEIGKARFYQGDFLQAANTFKYINTNPKTEEARLAALIWLMRNFSETAQFDEAEYVMDIVAKSEGISEKNIALFYKHAAQHYRLKNNFIKTAQYLELVLPYIQRKKEKGRYHYILGQIYQKENQTDLAYQNYTAAFAAHVSYEMDFNAQLQAAEVFTSDSPADIEKMEKYFQKLLADKKNEEYQDKIYYQLANFYLRQKNNKDRYPKAINALEKATFIGTDPQQKAYTYLKLGEIYYQQKNFQQAANYYDSAAQTLRPDMLDYQKIVNQAAILQEFYTTYQIIERQDLYLRLANLDPSAQKSYFETEIEKEKRTIDKQIAQELLERQRNEQAAQNQGVNPLQGGGQNASNWYFYNPVAMAQGKDYFARTWNNRPLEDNWRRSRKKEVSFSNPDNPDAVAEKPETEMSEDELKAARYAKLPSIEDRLAAVPKTQAEQAARKDSLEMALYQLGKIYHYQMQEERNALQTLSRLTKDFPQTQHLPEALYLMYMICQKEPFCESDPYKERVEKEFGTTIYAKLIQNPNYQAQMTQTDSLMESRYQSLYDSFQKEEQAQTLEQIAAFRAQYPNHPMLSKVRLIEILMMAQRGDKQNYKQALEKFNDEFPQNEQAEFVARLLKALEKESGG